MIARYDFIVVGGGIAGLAAATGLAERGVAVTLLEAQPQLGGRVRAWPAGDGERTMSRGFHAFFRQYYNLRALLRRTDPALERLVGVADYPLKLAGGPTDSFARMIQKAVTEFPNFKVAATTLRKATTATFNDWSALLYYQGQLYQSMKRDNLEIYDRVGGGDGFASGVAYGFLEGKGPQAAVEYGAAHGALAMTTPGDTSMVRVEEVEAAMKGKGARVIR